MRVTRPIPPRTSSRAARRTAVLCAAGLAAATLAACGGNDDNNNGSSNPSGSSGNVPTVSVGDFTNDFSAMASLKSLAAQGKGNVAVLLPDTTTSARYVTFDAPYLKEAFAKAGLSSSQYSVQNAQGSASTMQTQAEAAITGGASVLLVDALDSGSGAAIERNAESKGVKVIDYDRLTLGGPSDRYYVSFENVQVGKLIGQGMISCLQDWNVKDPNILVMDGDPTDNNAKQFAQGYNGVLNPKFDSGEFTKVGEPAGTWDPDKAQTNFAQQYTAHPDMNAVVMPNDDTANAVISYLQSKKTPARTFPTTGQDASLSGLQNILKGYQCGTVYKPVYLEAQAAAAIALYLRAGQPVPSGLAQSTTHDSQANTDVKTSIQTPVWVTADNMNDTVVKDDAVKVSDLCTPALKQACKSAGIQ